MPNIERLTTLLEYVEKLPPEQVQMGTYICSTAACLMGHAVTVFPETFRWNHSLNMIVPEHIGIPTEKYPGCVFFDLTIDEWLDIFAPFIHNDLAIQNLRDHIEAWSNA